MGSIVFWVVLGVCALAFTLTSYLARRDTETTIRHAIEKGVVADAESIARLKAERGISWPERLIVLGLITLFAAAGVVTFALMLGQTEPESVLPLLGIAAFTAFLAGGLLTAGVWLRRASAPPR